MNSPTRSMNGARFMTIARLTAVSARPSEQPAITTRKFRWKFYRLLWRWRPAGGFSIFITQSETRRQDAGATTIREIMGLAGVGYRILKLRRNSIPGEIFPRCVSAALA